MISELARPAATPRVLVIQPNPPIARNRLFRVFAMMTVFVLLVRTVCAGMGVPLVHPVPESG